VVQTYDPSTWEVEAGGSRVQGHFSLHGVKNNIKLHLKTINTCSRKSQQLFEIFPTIARKTFKSRAGIGELAQRLRAQTALPEVLSSIPSNHMVAHNHNHP
jgi:polyisoprenoid-binding protein YceI